MYLVCGALQSRGQVLNGVGESWRGKRRVLEVKEAWILWPMRKVYLYLLVSVNRGTKEDHRVSGSTIASHNQASRKVQLKGLGNGIDPQLSGVYCAHGFQNHEGKKHTHVC